MDGKILVRLERTLFFAVRLLDPNVPELVCALFVGFSRTADRWIVYASALLLGLLKVAFGSGYWVA